MDQARKNYTAINKLMNSLGNKRQETLLNLALTSNEEWKKPYKSELAFLMLCKQGIVGVALVLGVLSSRWVLRQEGCSELTKYWRVYVYACMVGAYEAVLSKALFSHHAQVLNLLCDDYILEEKARAESQ